MRAIIICKSPNLEDPNESFHPLQKLNNGEMVLERSIRLLAEQGITDISLSCPDQTNLLAPLLSSLKGKGLELKIVEDSGQYSAELFDPEVERTSFLSELTEDTLILSGSLIFSESFIRALLAKIPGHSALFVTEEDEECSLPRLMLAEGNLVAFNAESDEDVLSGFPLLFLKAESEEGSVLQPWSISEGYLALLDESEKTAVALRLLSHYDLIEQSINAEFYSVHDIEAFLSKHQSSKPLVLTPSHMKSTMERYVLSGLDNYYFLELSQGVNSSSYHKVLQVFLAESCDSIITIGDDASHNIGKLVKHSLAGRIPSESTRTATQKIVHVAVPCFTETGSESLARAYLHENEHSLNFEHDSLLPDLLILDPKFLEAESAQARRAVALETLSYAIDSLWSLHNNRLGTALALESLELFLSSFYCVFENNFTQPGWLLMSRYKAIKAAELCGLTQAKTAADALAGEIGAPPNEVFAKIAPYFWKHYSDNLIQSKPTIKRKHLASQLSQIQRELSVDTSVEMKEILSFLFELILSAESDNEQRNIETEKARSALGALDISDSPNASIVTDEETMREILRQAYSGNDIWRNSDEELVLPLSKEEFYSSWRKTFRLASLKKLQKVQTEILFDVIDFCEKAGIEYFLNYGSLLGAVRHGGFIPWNDNIEISMEAKDYKKFVAAAAEGLGQNYYLHNGENDKYAWFLGTRVCLKESFYERSKDRFFYAPKRGIYITVLPVGRVKSAKKQHTIKARVARLVEASLQVRLNPLSRSLRRRARWVTSPIRLLAKPQLQSLRDWLFMCGRGDYALLGYKYFVSNETVRFDHIYPLTTLEFEGRQVKVPQKYETLLEKFYGAYQELPQEEDIVYPVPVRVAFAPGDEYTLLSGNRFKEKPAPKSKIVRRFNKLFGPTTHGRRIATRIVGFFRARGIQPSENTRRLAALKNKHAGERCFLIGNGPSLTSEDLDMLAGEYTIGCNLIFKIYEQTVWRPSYYCVSDSGITRTHSRQLLDNVECKDLVIRDFPYHFMEVKPWDAIRLPYISVPWYKVHGNFLEFHYLSHATIMSMMIEFAHYMGFKEIYLIGVDGTSASKKGSHFTDSYFSEEMKKYGNAVKQKTIKNYDPAVQAVYLQKRTLWVFGLLREFSEKNGFKIYNATRGGVIEVFERANLDEVLAEKK